MASTTTASPDSMITIKVHYRGVTRKCKLPLRDMVPDTLETKIRLFLGISNGSLCTLERFSDSAGVFTVLNADSSSAWRQLNRAAKAKLKLKLRVMCLEESAHVEAEAAQESKQPLHADSTQPDLYRDLQALNENLGFFTRHRFATVEDEVATPVRAEAATWAGPVLSATGADSRSTPDVEPKPTAASQSTLATETEPKPITKVEQQQQEVVSELKPVDAAAPASDAVKVARSFTILCNSCDLPIRDVHYHCSTCDDGDFDLCPNCVSMGITCTDTNHWLIKRSTVDGRFIYSVTETIASKNRAACPSASQKESSPLKDASCCDSASTKRVAKDIASDANTTNHFVAMRAAGLVGPVGPLGSGGIRTCNSCVQDFPEHDFVHCTKCEDYDLCKDCFGRDAHGHHPGHTFVPASYSCTLPANVKTKMRAGRNVLHQAICDGCDSFISGVRHKCLDCPDWDYCNECVPSAALIHPNHRFVPIYEPVSERQSLYATSVHHGICCDGPHCSEKSNSQTAWIRGIRYKCTICHDLDFCATCEASPNNPHNRTHPIIKIRTPVRHVSVITREVNNGPTVNVLGDRSLLVDPLDRNVADQAKLSEQLAALHVSKSGVKVDAPVGQETPVPAQRLAEEPVESQAETVEKQPEQSAEAEVTEEELVEEQRPAQEEKAEAKAETTVEAEADAKIDAKAETEVDAKAETEVDAKIDAKVEAVPKRAAPYNLDLESYEYSAMFFADTIADGTVFGPNASFRQTWSLMNNGDQSWPAGCSVRFVGGNYMGHVDARHPAVVSDLVAASESTVMEEAVAPGSMAQFSVDLRAASREGRYVSYWRITMPDGVKFGDRMWCEIRVKNPTAAAEPEPVEEKETVPTAEAEDPSESMVFPKLEAEAAKTGSYSEEPSETAPAESDADLDSFEECGADLDSWDFSDEKFETDDEYDILDASDEEFYALQGKEQPQQQPKKK